MHDPRRQSRVGALEKSDKRGARPLCGSLISQDYIGYQLHRCPVGEAPLVSAPVSGTMAGERQSVKVRQSVRSMVAAGAQGWLIMISGPT